MGLNKGFVMKQLFIILSIFGSYSLNSAVLVVEGKFLNKNLYVLNSYASGGVGFCAKEVRVNGNITTDETNSNTFEIDLKALHLQYGEKVTIEIEHGDGCLPKILNPDDLKPMPTFEVVSMDLNPSGMLKWTAMKESGSLPYVIEQYKWNKWIRVGEVEGVGTPEQHDYSFQVALHSGENKFRVKQKGLNSSTKVSKEVTVMSPVQKPSFSIAKNYSRIDFSSETAFELYDAFGNVVKKGYGKQVKIDNLQKGEFYLCYDNSLSDFKK
jgi:hypothetical protein